MLVKIIYGTNLKTYSNSAECFLYRGFAVVKKLYSIISRTRCKNRFTRVKLKASNLLYMIIESSYNRMSLRFWSRGFHTSLRRRFSQHSAYIKDLRKYS
ncbi:hypothetical protein FOCC_FOCC016645 [Frankliniella occidentalis]|nr:hypothetical protein FOCC_FOCC016645 [Frankliniella occidentalis]